VDERTYTEAELQQRLALARSLARQNAWRDMLRRFTPGQRQRLANHMAHSFTITAIEVEDRYGDRPERMDGGVSRAEAIKAMDEDRARERAARTPGVAGTRDQTFDRAHVDGGKQ
jgi:hypothetical protein